MQTRMLRPRITSHLSPFNFSSSCFLLGSAGGAFMGGAMALYVRSVVRLRDLLLYGRLLDYSLAGMIKSPCETAVFSFFILCDFTQTLSLLCDYARRSYMEGECSNEFQRQAFQKGHCVQDELSPRAAGRRAYRPTVCRST